MPYKLYLDRNEIFECEVSVKNASLKGSIARLVVESADGVNFVFNGSIQNNKCNIPIRKLKGLIDENVTGNIFLEVIVEDTYFKPWESEFVVEEHTSVKVTFKEEPKHSSRPIVEVKSPQLFSPDLTMKNKDVNLWVPLYELSKICEKFDIKKSNLSSKKQEFFHIIAEYFKTNPEFLGNKKTILSGIGEFLS